MSATATDSLRDAYLTLCKQHLTRGAFTVLELPYEGTVSRLYAPVKKFLARYGLQIVRTVQPKWRAEGLRASSEAETMIGLARLDNLQQCVTDVIRDDIPGDFIETGVWRGGASIFMRAMLLAYGDVERTVWVADSFKGLPKPDPERYPSDRGGRLWEMRGLVVSLDEVKANFARYGMLDDQVQFLEGWFSDTLPGAPISQLAVLRLDGDMYESTLDALTALYPKLSVGGYVIVDDYGGIEACRKAVTDFRRKSGVEEKIHTVDWTGVYWRREI